MILGVCSFTWLIAEFILIARPKFVEKYFGLDKFYKFHGVMAFVSIVLGLLHKFGEDYVMGEMQTSKYGTISLGIFILVTVLAPLLMVESFIHNIKLVMRFRKYLQKFNIAKYEYQIAIHNLSVFALLILLIHVLYTSTARSSLAVTILYIAYFCLGFGFYLYHKLFRSIFLKNKMFTVNEIIKESANMCTINFSFSNNVKFDFKPGQFGFVKFYSNEISSEEHPFSFSSSPSNKEYISVTIKDLGDFTSKVARVKPGDKAIIDGPYGTFSYLNYPQEETIVFLAGGVGITPLLSQIRHMRDNHCNKKIALLWGVNTVDEIICRNEFETIQRELKNFYFVPVLYKDDSCEGEKGIINEENLESILTRFGLDLQQAGYYICGPTIFSNNILKALKNLGIKSKKIHYEKFSL
jgi:predicted ferric reductase